MMCFDIKTKIDDLTLTSTMACDHFGEISAIEQADDFLVRVAIVRSHAQR